MATSRLAGRYLDLGSQNIHGEIDQNDAKRFMAAFGRQERYSADLTHTGIKVEGLLTAAGFDYVAFDTFNAGRTRAFNLNFASLPQDMHGEFDVVANFGTSEHVANQFNVFKVAHDALKVGGVMLNNVPFYGMVDHGLFNYHPKFFCSLIANNRYEPIYWDFSGIFGNDTYEKLSFAVNGHNWEGKYVGSAMMNVMFKKTADAPFAPPTDAMDAGDAHIHPPRVNEVLGGPTYWFLRSLRRRLGIVRRSVQSVPYTISLGSICYREAKCGDAGNHAVELPDLDATAHQNGSWGENTIFSNPACCNISAIWARVNRRSVRVQKRSNASVRMT